MKMFVMVQTIIFIVICNLAVLIYYLLQIQIALKEEEVVVEELQHLQELQLLELAIRVGLAMGIVMIHIYKI